MILSKKYIFETRSTRLRRLVFNSIIVSFIVGSLLSGIFIFIPIYANNQNERTQAFLIKDTPDLLAVYTGDGGRIKEALKLAKKHPSAKLFISGVYQKNSFSSLLNKQIDNPKDFLEDQNIDAEIDYKSRNTLENVISTVRYAEENKEKYKKILIISSDYHILRISFLESIIVDEDDIEFYYHATDTDYSKWSNLRKLFKESIKILQTFGLYFIWDD